MAQKASSRSNYIFLGVGLLFLSLGILLSPASITGLGTMLGVNLNLGGVQGLARIWGLKITFILTGVPLVLYKVRARRGFKLFFDLAVGLILTLVLVFLIEGIFFRLNVTRAKLRPTTSLNYSEVFIDIDEELGYKLKPNLEISAVQKSGGTLIYDVTYSTDEHGRRLTPLDSPDKRSKFILFFGGSFTFGDGVEDDQTLAAYVGQAAPDFRPYNFGVPGYGTQQLLIKLQSDDIMKDVGETDGIAVYNFICPHIDRVIGSLYLHNSNGSFMPYLTLDAHYQLVRKGTLVSGRPFRSALYTAIGLSQTASYLNIIYPPINEDHIALTVRIMAESSDIFKDKFDSEEFYVLIFPAANCAPKVIPHLEQANVKYLDYSTFFLRGDEELWIPDGHPTAAANKRLADRLAIDLGLGPGEGDKQP